MHEQLSPLEKSQALVKTKKQRLLAHVILDRSGSMSTNMDEAINGVNHYIKDLAADTGLKVRASVTIFDSTSIDLIRDRAKAKKWRDITLDECAPRASTPLLDAVGQTVNAISAKEGENVAIAVMTDGYENASHEFTKEQIAALLKEKQEKENWLVLYLGANHDAWGQAGHIGMAQAMTMDTRPDNMGATLSAASKNVRSYGLTGSQANAVFTDEQRRKAKKEKTA